jgi:hypothetical protein
VKLEHLFDHIARKKHHLLKQLGKLDFPLPHRCTWTA